PLRIPVGVSAPSNSRAKDRERSTHRSVRRSPEGSDFQEISLFPHIPRNRLPDPDLPPFRLMNVAAKEIVGLFGFDECTDGPAATVHAAVDPVELSVLRRRVTDHD